MIHVIRSLTSSVMKRARRPVRVLWLIGWVGAFVLPFGEAVAGGLYINEFSTSSQANAGAGRGAWAPDASVTLHNPAAMTRLDDHGFASGFSIAFGRVRFDASSSSPSGSDDGGNQAGIGPIASMSYVHKVSDRVRFGLTFFSLSGSILDPENDWAGRFEMTELSFLTISLSPTLGVRVTDWLSIGGGPIATYGTLDWDLMVDFPLGGESEVRLDNFDDWEAAGRVGVLLHPGEDFALSVYYNSETDFKLDGKLRLPLGFAANLDVELPLAQFVEVSGWWQVTERLAFLATFNWEDWSTADELSITLGGRTVDATTGFRDTYKFGVGANWLVADRWLLQTGVMVDTSALKDRDRTTALPIDRQIRAAIGVQHELSEAVTLGLSFAYVNLGPADVNRPSVIGDYKDNDIFVFGLTVSFKKLWWSERLTFSGSGARS